MSFRRLPVPVLVLLFFGLLALCVVQLARADFRVFNSGADAGVASGIDCRYATCSRSGSLLTVTASGGGQWSIVDAGLHTGMGAVSVDGGLTLAGNATIGGRVFVGATTSRTDLFYGQSDAGTRADLQSTAPSGFSEFNAYNDQGHALTMAHLGSTWTPILTVDTADTGMLRTGSLTTGGLTVVAGGANPLKFATADTVRATITGAGVFTVQSTFQTEGTTILGDASGDAVTWNAKAVSCPNDINYDVNTLYLDATNNRVGVGTASPSWPFQVTHTFPSGAARAAAVIATGAGSAVGSKIAFSAEVLAGYTGASATRAGYFGNASAGTANSLSDLNGNFGFDGQATATTTGANIGASGTALGGNLNVGLYGQAFTAKNSATNVAVLGQARNTGSSPTQIGGYFILSGPAGTNPGNYSSAALIADNGAETSPIFLARDNGTAVFTIADTGTSTFTAAVLHNGATTLGDASGDALTITSNTATISNGLTFTGGSVTLSSAFTASSTSANSVSGRLDYDSTDSSASPGNATINKPEGRSAIAASASSVTITNSMVTAATNVYLAEMGTDATCTGLYVTPGSGSFVVTCKGAAATGNLTFGWHLH